MAQDISSIIYQEFLNGNINAFDKIVLMYKNSLINFITRYIKDYGDSEDISQEVFATIYVYRQRYNSKYSFKTYLYTIAKNKAIDYLRKKKDYININDIQIQDSYILEDEIIKSEADKQILNLLKKLKKDYEIVLYLSDIEKMPYKDIAKVTKKTVSNVKVTVFRARKALKQLMIEKM